MSESDQPLNIHPPRDDIVPASVAEQEQEQEQDPTPTPEEESTPTSVSSLLTSPPVETEPLLSSNNLTIEINTPTDIVGDINSPVLENIIPTEPVQKFFPDSDDELVNDVKTLSQYVTLILTVTDVENKYSLTIDSKLKSILTTLLSTGTYFDKIEQTFKDIVQDNKIDANDVPKIMILLVDLYTTLKNAKITFNKELCGEVLKTVFTVIIKEKLIPVTDKEKELIRCIYDIIESSVQLAQMSDSDNKGGLFACLKKYIK